MSFPICVKANTPPLKVHHAADTVKPLSPPRFSINLLHKRLPGPCNAPLDRLKNRTLVDFTEISTTSFENMGRIASTVPSSGSALEKIGSHGLRPRLNGMINPYRGISSIWRGVFVPD